MSRAGPRPQPHEFPEGGGLFPQQDEGWQGTVAQAGGARVQGHRGLPQRRHTKIVSWFGARGGTRDWTQLIPSRTTVRAALAGRAETPLTYVPHAARGHVT